MIETLFTGGFEVVFESLPTYNKAPPIIRTAMTIDPIIVFVYMELVY
jgi:hypothetical protein